MSILDLFCALDDFWQAYEPGWRRELLARSPRRRWRATGLCPSEVMTLVVLFHQSHYRTFKAFYTEHVCVHLRAEFPGLVSYVRCVALVPRVLLPLTAYLHTRLGACTGISFVDSTPLAVCRNARIRQHRVFLGRAARGKNSVGRFFGFERHLVVNDRGELLAFCLTPGHVDDRRPVPKLARRLFGKLFADRGSVSQPLAQRLLVEQGVELITWLRKGMRERLITLSDKLLLRKRAIIETIHDQLKNICQIEHSRHRSSVNFLVNLVAGFVAYVHQPSKPSLGLGSLTLPPVSAYPALTSLLRNGVGSVCLSGCPLGGVMGPWGDAGW